MPCHDQAQAACSCRDVCTGVSWGSYAAPWYVSDPFQLQSRDPGAQGCIWPIQFPPDLPSRLALRRRQSVPEFMVCFGQLWQSLCTEQTGIPLSEMENAFGDFLNCRAVSSSVSWSPQKAGFVMGKGTCDDGVLGHTVAAPVQPDTSKGQSIQNASSSPSSGVLWGSRYRFEAKCACTHPGVHSHSWLG